MAAAQTSVDGDVVMKCQPVNSPPRKQHFTEYFTDPDVDNLRINNIHALIYPQLLLEEIPISTAAKQTVMKGRREISKALSGRGDDRLVAIVGPCSIHDPAAALEYAKKLVGLKDRVKDEVVIVMRVYFEKPRTIAGWKGLINDPNLDLSFDINTGLRLARRLLASINEMGLPAGCEYLDTIMPQYTADLTSWAAIGARTTECQLHRELASGLSMPVGFKNGTSGDIQIAIDACRSAAQRHAFLSITKHGIPAIIHSMGNEDSHIILRGGAKGPNYESETVQWTHKKLREAGNFPKLIVDCSHGNSQKDPKKQSVALNDVCKQIAAGDDAIGGVMIESHLKHGAQALPSDEVLDDLRKQRLDSTHQPAAAAVSSSTTHSPVLEKLEYGVSITDGCIGWEETEELLEALAAAVRTRRSQQSTAAPPSPVK